MRRALLGLLFILSCSVASAVAGDREARLKDMIDAHRHKARKMSEGIGTSGAGNLGTALNEAGVKEYSCAALAFLFGKDDIFRRIGTIEETPRETYLKTPLAVFGDALFHENWALSAEYALAMSARDRVETWNLDCVRQHGIAEDEAMPQIAPAAEFEVDGDQIYVLGDIEPGFYERFAEYLAKSPRVKYVALGSGGGSVRDAILAGLLIRKKRLETTLKSDCYSACPLLFLGGVQRTVLSPYRRLGFHQISRDGRAVPPDDEVYALVRKYADSMGADGSFVLAQMQSAKPSAMTYPDVWELCEPGITTWVQRGC